MSGRTLDPSLLKAFVAVADLRSFTRSAVALNRTQSAISAQIKRLEDQIGLRLLDRSTAHVALTPAGESLVGYARRILSLSEEAMQRLAEHEVAGRVRIGVMDDYGTIVLPSLAQVLCGFLPRCRDTHGNGTDVLDAGACRIRFRYRHRDASAERKIRHVALP